MQRKENTNNKLKKMRMSLLTLAMLASTSLQAGTVAFSDNFESGLGNWTNVATGDNRNWLLDSNGTPSSSTGPSAGANGSSYYTYFETSSGYAYSAGDSAILLGPVISGSNVKLTFDYHMYGRNIGELAVDVLVAGSWINGVWSTSGQQQTSSGVAYLNANIDLSAYSLSQIRFRATAVGGYMGDIAIDNLVIETGPSLPAAPEFNSATLVKTKGQQDQPYSDSIADDASDANGDVISFSKVSGPQWLTVASDGTLSGQPSAADVGNNSFVVSASDGQLSSQAQLEIEVLDNSVPIIVTEDDFESGFGNWTNASVGDNKNWTRDSSGTPSSGTGPQTGAEATSYYLYLETSSGSAYTVGDSAILLSPNISNSNLKMDFSYHMYGSNMGTLAVDVLSNGSWVEGVWSLSGQQQSSNSAAYNKVELDLSSYSVEQVRFKATAAGGYMGDMALDKIKIYSVPTGPAAPVFSSDPLAKKSAIKELAYSETLAADATDANGDAMTFSKVSGPTWLNVALDGSLSGTPLATDTGANAFQISVSDGVLSTTATINIFVSDGSFSSYVFPHTAGHGVDGGSNAGWVTDGVVDEFAVRTNYSDDVVVRIYRSLDFTKFSNYYGAFEFKLPQDIIDNSGRVVIESASLELDIDGSATGTVDFHGYLADGTLQLSDFSHDNLIQSGVTPGQKMTVDVTAHLQSLLGQSDYAGFLLKPWSLNYDMFVGVWNGTANPIHGHISGQISRLKIDYRIE